jgi:hypothetical protein
MLHNRINDLCTFLFIVIVFEKYFIKIYQKFIHFPFFTLLINIIKANLLTYHTYSMNHFLIFYHILYSCYCPPSPNSDFNNSITILRLYQLLL